MSQVHQRDDRRPRADRRQPAERRRILISFAAIVFIGLGAGAGGVLLPPQGADFGVDKGTISLIFVSFSVGYILCAVANGALIHRLGVRTHLMVGLAVATVALGGMALRPAFWGLLLLQAGFGYGMGALDAGLNAYLSTLQRSTSLLNYFHAFFGVGALTGPVVAAAILEAGLAWTAVYALLAVLALLLLPAFVLFPAAVRAADEVERPRVTSALSHRVVWIAAAFLGVYVGIETGIGNWGFSFLTEDRGQDVLAAGWVVSGYWGGLTLGRFVLNATAERVGLSLVALTAGCIGGVVVSAAVVWIATSALVTTVGLVAVGFFLGPLFPTMIAALPRLVPDRLVATAIGILVATSIGGSALFPWLVGYSAESSGAWVLLPITIMLALLLGLAWWRIAVRLIRPRLARDPSADPASEPMSA
jgi:fucose permease